MRRFLSFGGSGRKMNGGNFRYTFWDPPLILSQIITMQSIFYVGLGLFLSLADFMLSSHRSLDQIFKFQELHVRDGHGRAVLTAFFLNSLLCSLGMWWVVHRTKQCLDFTVTIHFFHLFVVWIYNGMLPNTVSWWVVQVVGMVVTCVCAEFLCMRTELAAIPVSLGAKADL